jgi:tetratricopeptide (TPR) repeat protein
MFGIGSIKDPLERGRRQYEKGQHDAVIESFTQAISKHPLEAYSYRASDYHNLRKYDEALADHDRAIEIAPNRADLYYFRGNTYHMFDDPTRRLLTWNVPSGSIRAMSARVRTVVS